MKPFDSLFLTHDLGKLTNPGFRWCRLEITGRKRHGPYSVTIGLIIS